MVKFNQMDDKLFKKDEMLFKQMKKVELDEFSTHIIWNVWCNLPELPHIETLASDLCIL
jgi:hypothetical protein